MSGNEATRFFDTSGCLNLQRPTTGTPIISSSSSYRRYERRRPVSSSIVNRGQLKIDLYNFDHIDYADSKYVLTSPRSLEACSRLNIKPITLLPKRLADIQDDIGSEKVRLSTLSNVRDQMEVDRLAKLQRCREEREKIIREETLAHASRSRTVDPQPTHVHETSIRRRPYSETRFNPSSSLVQGLHEPTTISSVPTHSHSSTGIRYPEYEVNADLPPRPTSATRSTVSNSILKSSSARWPPPVPSPYYQNGDRDDQYDPRASTSAHFVDDVRRLNKSLQRMSTSDTVSKQHNNDRYMNGLENVKEIIERRAARSAVRDDPEVAAFEKKQYEILLGHYDHELKIQKARENARRAETEKEIERYSSLLHDLSDQTMADERRQTELRRKVDKLRHTRHLYETLQAKNYEQQLLDLQKRRYELGNDLRQKDQRTRHFIKDKQEAMDLSRSLAKSSQDLREYLRETNETFDDRAKKAELTSSVLVKKANKAPANRRHLQSSLRT
ncbi:unnamed protein product [Adineta ricciae]|uniref:Uncharacterized protein n=1 Tax=Adineta ricciae TaxID=249248 RepID=A0A813ZA33_ADIRI|nr:unnamed protein product [Adineta ricciae]CAF0896445.1 unnamed protein product [Adineta ricciae]